MPVTDDFTSSELDLNGFVTISSPTALVWGPDGRLYVTQQAGDVNVLDVAFGDPDPTDDDTNNKFYVTAAEKLDLVQDIPNHNDDGSSAGTGVRQVTGIDVVQQFDSNGAPVEIDGKPAVVMYVTSSDNRIGAGGSGNDAGLDTNSGVITRITQTQNGWEAVDIVRGLPRSEENHATNGLEVIQELDGSGNLISERVIVASGGNANTGAPSNNFAGQQETPYSAALLEIDLDEIRAIEAADGIKIDDGREYVYDMPTLDDPTRLGLEGDPFGGNDGLNSAKLLADGPVQIYSAGYRNPYDVEVTDDGRVYTYDNGANNNWGGRPAGEDTNANSVDGDSSTPLAYIGTNLFVEDNQEPFGNFDPQNWDSLHEATRSDDLNGRSLAAGLGGAQTYTWDHPDFAQPLTLVYGGHPNPTRAEGARAGLLYTPESGVGNAKLMVSNVGRDDGNGGTTSDFLEVVDWFVSIGYSDAFINATVVALDPGKLYSDTFVTGFGGADANGRPTTTDVFSLVEDANGDIGLPADITEIVAEVNKIEGNYLEAGFSDGSLDTGKGSVNGLTEYTSNIFDEAGLADMQGALIAASLNTAQYFVIGRDSDGVVQTTTTTSGNGSGVAQNVPRTIAADKDFIQSGGAPLGLASIGDDVDAFGATAFRGTIWGAIYKQNGPVIEILQPGTADGNALLGENNYAGVTPVDVTDNDLDGVNHINDPFDFDADNGLQLAAGETILLNFSQVDLASVPEFSGTIGDTGLLGAALDGVTPNRDAQSAADGIPAGDQEDGLFDNGGNIIPGGNAPILQIKAVKDGTAIGTANTLRDGLHTGVKLDDDIQRLVAEVEIFNWYADQPGGGRVSGLTFGDGTQSNFVRFVFGDVGNDELALEVGVEVDDNYVVLGTITDPAFTSALDTGQTLDRFKKVTLQLEISDIGGNYTLAANYKVNGETEFASVPLSNTTLPVGVLRDVLDGTHQISDNDENPTTLSSGAAIGIVAEKDNGVAFTSVDFDVIRIEGIGNEVIATTEAEAEAAGTAGEDTVIYDGPAADIALDPTVENFDGSPSDTDWSVTGTPSNNVLTVGSGSNTVTTGDGEDVVEGTKSDLNGDEITDFSEADKVVITDASISDAANVSFQAGSAIVNVNGTTITFSGPDFEGFDPSTGDNRFAFNQGQDGLEITLIPDETVIYRVNAGGADVTTLDDGPDWVSDLTLDPNGPISITGTQGSTFTNALTDAEDEIDYTPDVDPTVVPWQLFVEERSENTPGGAELTYNFDVALGGTYKITLLYVENWPNSFAAPDRIFDVAVEGGVPAEFEDIYPLRDATDFVDGPTAPVPTFANTAPDAEKQPYLGVVSKREFVYTATDDSLSLTFQHNALTNIQNPKINAIEITQLGALPTVEDVTGPVITSVVVEDSLSDQDSPRDLTLTLTDDIGLDVATFASLDGSELSFTGITPGGINGPSVQLSADGKTATVVYELLPPADTNAWPDGDFSVDVAANAFSDAAGNTSAAAGFLFGFSAPLTQGDIVLAVNAGGGAVDGAAYGLPGVTFEADTDAAPHPTVDISSNNGNNTNSSGADDTPFAGEPVPDDVFVSERWGNNFSYNVEVPNGTYEVDLYFAETYQGLPGGGLAGGIGSRVFDASLEGDVVLNDYDLFDDADGILGNGVGAPATKIIKTFEVTVTDGVLNISLDALQDGGEVVADNAKISAFVVRVPEASGATATLTGDTNVTEDAGTASYTVTLSEAVTETTVVTLDIASAAVADVPGDAEATGGGTQLTLTFEPGGALTQTATVDIADDTLPELDESFTVTMSGIAVTAGGSDVVTTSIAANDGEVDSVDAVAVVDGDFSDDGAAPTDIGTLIQGETVIVASQQGDSAPGGRERDYFTFTVAPGDELTGIILEEWTTAESGTPQAFIGIQEGAAVTVDPVSFANAGDLLGGYIYNEGDVEGVAGGDGNLLAPTALGNGSAQGIDFGDGTGFDGPLPAGTYTIWLNQGGDISTAKLRLVTQEFVEVVTIAVAASDTVAENGDFGTTDVGFDLTASDSFTGDIEITVDVNDGTNTTPVTQTVSFTDGLGRLTLSVDNDNVDDGDDVLSLVNFVSGSVTGSAAAVDFTAPVGADATVTEDDGILVRGGVVLAINAGGPQVVQDGITFEAATNATNGEPFASGAQFTDSNGGNGQQPVFDGTVYETEINDGGNDGQAGFTFSAPVPDADAVYFVDLYFGEIFASTAGARVFSVFAEGDPTAVIENLDVIGETGDDDIPLIIQLAEPISPGANGAIDLEFIASQDRSKVSAIVIREAVDATAISVSVSPTEVDEDAGQAEVVFTRAGATDEPLTVTFTIADGSAVAGADYTLPATNTVTFGVGETEASLFVDIIDNADESATGTATFDVTIIGAEVPSGGPVGAGTTSATVTIDDDEFVDPADIDGDGVLNIDDPFAFDGSNGLDRALTTGNSFRQDFDVATTDPFSAEGGFTGILVNDDFTPADTSETDPYGDRTSGSPTVEIANGALTITSSDQAAFATGTTGTNTLKDGYQSGADVSGVDTFEVVARANSADFLTKATTTGGFEQFGISLGAGGVDDFIKLVLSDQNTGAQRVQLAHNGSLEGGEANFNIGGADSGAPVIVDLSLVGDVEFTLSVDRNAGANGAVAGKVDFFAASDGALLTSFSIPGIAIAANSSFLAALDGNNPLTGGAGGLAYGVFVTDVFGGTTANQITANYDFLEIRATDPIDLSIAAPAAPVAEAGDDGVTTVDFPLSAPGFTGTMDIDVTVNETPQTIAGVAFLDGVGTLSLDVANDDVADGDLTLTVVLTGTSNPSVTVDATPVDGVVTEDDSAPVSVPETVVTFEDVAISFNPAANDTDADTDPAELTVTAVGDSSTPDASVALVDGVVTVTPSNGFLGDVTFTYDVTDTGGNTTQGTATVTVTAATLVSIGDAPTQIEEGDTGSETLVFPITTAPAAEQTLSLEFTVDGVPQTADVTLDATGAGSISIDVANDDAVEATELTTVVLTAVTTTGFAISTANAAATGRVIDDDEVTQDIMVDEDIPVGDESDPYELSDGVQTIDTSATTQPTNIVGNAEENTFTVGLGEDKIDLQDNGGADKVVGTPEALDGIEIANAEEDDEVVITGGENAVIVSVVEGSTEVTVDPDGNTADASDQFTVIYEESNLIPTLVDGVLTVVPGSAQTFRIQAEDFDSSTTYGVQSQGAADGGQVAFLPDGGATGSATYDLTGIIPAGTYTLLVVYFDENDGESTIGVNVSSTGEADFDASFQMDDPTPFNAAQAENIRTKAFADVVIGEDGTLTLSGTTDGGEFARIDYFEFIEQRAEVDPENTSPYAPFPLVDQAVTEGEEFAYDAGAAFVDDEEDPLSFTATSDKEGGALPDGLLFDPATGQFSGTLSESGTFLITVTANDDNTDSEPQTFTLTVGDVNFAPEVTTPIADQFVTVGATVNLDVTSAFSDADGDDLTFSLTGTLPAGVTFDADNGTFNGAPTGDPGSFQVTVTASDGELEVSDTFLFNVGGGASQDPIRIEAEDADALSSYFIQNNTQDRIRLLTDQTGTATFDLADVAPGEYAIRVAYYDEADGVGNIAIAVLSDGVATPVDNFELDEDTGTNAANANSFRVKTLASNAQIGAGDQLVLTGIAQGGEFTRVDYIELVPVGGTNFAPTEVGGGVDDVTLVGLVPVDINVADAFIDPEEDALTFAIVDGPAFLQIDPTTGALTGTPDVGGVFTVVVSAADTANAAIPATSTFTLTVEIPDNELPTLDFPVTAFTVGQGVLLEESVTFTDPEGGTITYNLSEGAPAWLTIDQFGTLSGTPAAEDVVTDLPVSIIATDPLGGTSSVEVLITVNNTNDAPEVGTPLEDQSAVVGQEFLYELPEDAFTDADIPEGDALTYSAEVVGGGDLPAWLSIDPTTGALSGTPDTGDDVAVIVTATDLADESVSAAPILINVTPFEVPADPVQIEVEDFTGVPTAQNFEVNNLAAASGQAILRLQANELGIVTHDLSAYAGQSFKVAVTYIDETDGAGNARVLVDGQELGAWAFDGTAGTQNVPGGETGNFVQPGNFRTIELDTVVGLTDTSVLTLEVQAEGGEFGRVDFITLIPAELPETNEAPIAVTVTPVAPDLAEDTDTTDAVKVGDIAITDDILGTNELSLAGADADVFEIVGTELFLKAGTLLDFETKPTFDVTVQVNDPEVGAEPVDASTDFTLALADANDAPVLTVTPVLAEISQDADTSAPTKVADIVVADDALGSFVLNLTGDDSDLFEIVTDVDAGTIELVLKADVVLDPVTNAQLDVTVELDDPEIGDMVAEATEAVAITVIEGDVVAGDTVVLRINAFGDTVAATDGGPNWQADLKDDLGTPGNENNAYLTLDNTDPAQDRGDAFAGYTGDTGLLPTELPEAVLDTARSSNDPFSYDIPIADLGGPGDFEVKLYFAELFEGNQAPGNRVFDIEVEGSSPGVLQDFDPSAPNGGGDLTSISYDVTVTDGELNIRFAQDTPVPTDNPIINAIEIVRKGDVVVGPTDGEALFTANIGGGDLIGLSTFATNAMQITNQSSNDVSITRVVIDLADTIIPDTGFDTQSEAEGGPIGDATNKPFELDGATSGLALADITITMGDEIVDPQTGGEGNNELILEFEDGAFAVGDLLSFSIDIDPFTATVGPIGGAVAGFEISGGTVSVEFSDGTSATSVITPPDASLAGRALVKAGQEDLGAPTLTLGDGTTAARVVNQANLPISIDAGIENAGATARVFILDTAFVSNGDSVSSDPPPQAPNGIQGNNAQAPATVVDVQLDENGTFDGTIPMTRSTTQQANANGNLGFNYFAAGVVDSNGEVTQISDPLVVEFDPDANVSPIGDPTGNPVGDVLLRINAFGDTVAATDDGPDWQGDTAASPSPFFFGTQNRGDLDTTPATPNLTDVPNEIFATARSDDGAFAYTIPVVDLPGIDVGDTVTVNLYFAEAATDPAFNRVFDVQIEGATAINDLNPAAFFGTGQGGVISTVVEVVGGTLNIDFLNNNLQNAIVSGIEIVAGGTNPINGGGVIDPPADPADALAVLGVDDGNFDGTVQGETVDSQNDGGANGSVVLTVLDGNNTVESSNFGANSFELTNTGNKEVAAVFIDIRNAVFADQVFDNDGTGGDTASAPFEIDGDDGTGAYFVGADGVAGNNDDNLFFAGATPAADNSGLGSANISGGYRGLLIRFDGTEGGFTNGETVGFSGDGDSNSIAGFSSGLLNPNNVTADGFDTGGQSGSELVGSSFTVLFADGTTATGYLGSDTTQAGAAGEAVQGRADKLATLTVATGSGSFDSGQTGTYGGTVPTITVAGTPGDTVRVVLHKGFQPTDGSAGGSPDTVQEVIEGRLNTLVPDFQVNNAFDVQTVDVVIGGNGLATVPAGAFDFVNTTSGESFPGDDVQPLALTAAVVEQVSDTATISGSGASDLVPVGPVSPPIYLTNPTGTPVDDSGVVQPAPDGYFELVGSGTNQYFKIQIEDENGTGGDTPGGKWQYLTAPDGDGDQSGFQGDGYYLFGSETSTAIESSVGGNELLEYTIFVPEDGLGVYDINFIVSRDGDFASDQQNDLWVNLKPADQAGNGNIEAFFTNAETKDAEPTADGFIKLFGGPNNGTWGAASGIDGAPGNEGNFPLEIEFTESGLYTFQVDGRSQGFHVDYFEIYKGTNPGAGSANSAFINGDPDTGGGGGGGTTGDTVRIQAEDFSTSNGYVVQGAGAADLGELIAVSGGAGSSGTATYNLSSFGLGAGTYNVTIGYVDESDGASTLNVAVGDSSTQIILDDDANSDNATGSQNFREATIVNAVIDGNDVLTLNGINDGGEFTRVDYIDFTPTDGSTGGGDTGGGDTGGGDTGGGDTGGGDTGGGDTGGGDTGGGDTGGTTGQTFSTQTDGFKLEGTENDDVFLFFGGATANVNGNGGADLFDLQAAMFTDGQSNKVQIKDYQPGVDIVDINGFAINDIIELANRVQFEIGPDNDVLEFVNLNDADVITFI